MMDAFHRALTGQTLSKWELRLGALFIAVWFVMDAIQFVAWLVGIG